MFESEKQHILIVDNQPENLLAIEAILKAPELEIIKAGSGKEALCWVLKYDFALILLDVQMLKTDGFEPAELIGGTEESRQIPIIFVTADKEQKHLFNGHKVGAVDYLFKPIEPEILKSKVRVFLEFNRQRRLITKQANELLELRERFEAEARERAAGFSKANKILQQEIVKRKQTESSLKDLAVQLQASKECLVALTIIDPITGLLNRQGLQQILSNELRRTFRQDDRGLLAVLVNLDNFKQINDSLGHAVGDVVLKELATKMKSSLRAKDYVSRIDGDEFLILLPQTRLADGFRVAERIRLAVSDVHISLSSGDVKTTASLGVVKVSQEILSVDELLSQIHCVLRRSKQGGKNRVSSEWVCTSEKSEQDNSAPDILEAIRSNQQFRTVHLPIYRLKDEQKVGSEILSRSSIPGLEMPDDFFRLCSENNILSLADHQFFKNCIAAAQLLPAESKCHINLFPSTLIDVPIQHLLEVFPADIPPGKYCIEINEQQIIGDPSHLLEVVDKLKQAGILIAIDDVGFGHSCLESLIILHPDIIKIDRSCVMGITRNPLKVRSFERILKVANALGAQVIAEGIETRESLELLKQLGVEYGQGFLWGKPI